MQGSPLDFFNNLLKYFQMKLLQNIFSKTGLTTAILSYGILALQVNSAPYEGNNFQSKDDLSGLWLSETNNQLWSINKGQVEYFEVTKGSDAAGSVGTCLKLFGKNVTENENFKSYADLSLFNKVSSKKLHLASFGSLAPIALYKIAKLPMSCDSPYLISMQYVHQPEVDFTIFWNSFNELYASFNLRGVTQEKWNKLYFEYFKKAKSTTNAQELFNVFDEVLQLSFNEKIVEGTKVTADVHVELFAPTLDKEILLYSKSEHDRGKAAMTNPLNTHLWSYIDTTVFSPLVVKGSEYGVYSMFAKINGSDTGLLVLNSMFDFSLKKLALDSNTGFNEELAAVGELLKQTLALTAKHKLTKIVIDVRDNVGGYDAIALKIAGFFASTRIKVLKKAKRTGGTIDHMMMAPSQSFAIEPVAKPFSGEVVLLTSRYTVSAGEIFAMTMKALPNVTVVGESTSGSLSDVLNMHTSNGWSISLSNELYRPSLSTSTSSKASLEGSGVKPDYLIVYKPQKDESKAPFIDEALEYSINLTLSVKEDKEFN